MILGTRAKSGMEVDRGSTVSRKKQPICSSPLKPQISPVNATLLVTDGEGLDDPVHAENVPVDQEMKMGWGGEKWLLYILLLYTYSFRRPVDTARARRRTVETSRLGDNGPTRIRCRLVAIPLRARSYRTAHGKQHAGRVPWNCLVRFLFGA